MENLGQTDLNYIFVYHKLSCRWQTARHICAIRNGVANASTPVSVTVQNFIVLSQMLNKGVQMLWENIAGSPKLEAFGPHPLGLGYSPLESRPSQHAVPNFITVVWKAVVAIETVGIWHHQAVELVGLQEIGRRTASITGDAKESTFLFQQLSVALQSGNAVSFQNTFTAS